MRLTLRTLLAYLDDILEPADAREIGTKIAESPVAATMVDRIREVMRRRRITAPELTGPGSGPDPNLVAEYLDNTLTPEHVAEIERICLESDIHLAETAGCHQILTIVLGEPVDIPTRTRERMYALGAIAPVQPQNGNPEVREQVPPATADTRRTAAAAAASVHAGDETFAQRVPDYLRRRTLWQRFWPAVVVAVLVGWLVLVLFDPTNRNWLGTRSIADTAPAAPTDVAAPIGVAPPAAEPVVVAPEPAAPDIEVAVVPESINPLPPPDLVEAPVEPAAEPVVESPAAVATIEPVPEPAPAEPAPPAVIEQGPPVMYTSLDGIALQYQPDVVDWNVMPRQSLVKAGDWIASPEPFAARLEVGGGRLSVILNSGSTIQTSVPPEGWLTSLRVDRGRVGLYRPAGEADPVAVALQVGNLAVDMELLEPGTLVGVEVLLRQPTGMPPEPVEPAVDGGIFLVAGSAAVKSGDGERIVLSADNGFLRWPAVDVVWQPEPLLSLPQWLTPDGSPLPPVRQTYAKLYERMFPLDQPVSVSIPAIVKDGRPKISQLAVETLGLTQNVPQLLLALQAGHDESRQAAIVGLREWLPRSLDNPDNAAILRDRIEHYFQDDEVEPLNELLWGYSPQDFRNADVSARLIDWLSHDNVAIRELAIYQIRTGTNRPTDYHPLATAVQRQAAIARLQEVVRRYGALLPPE
jgi:hypothetical protein